MKKWRLVSEKLDQGCLAGAPISRMKVMSDRFKGGGGGRTIGDGDVAWLCLAEAKDKSARRKVEHIDADLRALLGEEAETAELEELQDLRLVAELLDPAAEPIPKVQKLASVDGRPLVEEVAVEVRPFEREDGADGFGLLLAGGDQEMKVDSINKVDPCDMGMAREEAALERDALGLVPLAIVGDDDKVSAELGLKHDLLARLGDPDVEGVLDVGDLLAGTRDEAVMPNRLGLVGVEDAGLLLKVFHGRGAQPAFDVVGDDLGRHLRDVLEMGGDPKDEFDHHLGVSACFGLGDDGGFGLGGDEEAREEVQLVVVLIMSDVIGELLLVDEEAGDLEAQHLGEIVKAQQAGGREDLSGELALKEIIILS